LTKSLISLYANKLKNQKVKKFQMKVLIRKFFKIACKKFKSRLLLKSLFVRALEH